MLTGLQFSFTPDIPPYPLENPSVGSAIATHSGIATVTRLVPAGEEQIIFADYDSGIEQPHIREEIKELIDPEEVSYVAPSGWIATKSGSHLNPLHYAIATQSPSTGIRQRRHSPKGKASGTIKQCQGNRKRKTPSTSYYYEWLEHGKKRSLYIPSRQVEAVRAMIEQRCSVDEILQIIKQPKETP